MLRDSHNRRWNHFSLAIISLTTCIFVISVTSEPIVDQLSIATAYICLFLITIALSIGPLQIIRNGRISLNIYLRRDVGIWAAIAGLVHCVIATKLAMTPEYINTYVDVSFGILSENARADLFLWGSVSAFVIAVLLLILLSLSNQRAMKSLGVTWWKRLQRLAYLALVLTIIHGLAFQLIESRSLILIGILLIALLQVAILQSIGFALVIKHRT